jgi:hypothetical protein
MENEESDFQKAKGEPELPQIPPGWDAAGWAVTGAEVLRRRLGEAAGG